MRRFLLGSVFLAIQAVVFSTVGGCSSKSVPTPNAYITSELTPSADLGSAACTFDAASWVTIGSVNTDNTVSSVDDGSSSEGYGVSVSCSVTANSDGTFSVNAQAIDSGFGSVGIVGTFATSGMQSNISASFQRGDTGNFTASNCTASYDTSIGSGGVAAGRVWATIDCPDVSDITKSVTVSGKSEPITCAATATVKFQNCTQ